MIEQFDSVLRDRQLLRGRGGVDIGAGGIRDDRDADSVGITASRSRNLNAILCAITLSSRLKHLIKVLLERVFAHGLNI